MDLRCQICAAVDADVEQRACGFAERLRDSAGYPLLFVWAAERSDRERQDEANQVDDPEDSAGQGDSIKDGPSRRIPHLGQQSGDAQHHAQRYRQENRDDDERQDDSSGDDGAVHGLFLPVSPILLIGSGHCQAVV